MPLTIALTRIPGYTLAAVPRLVLPFAPLYLQAYLLLSRGPASRPARLALLPASLAALKGAWLDRRVTDERYVIWNFVLGCAAVFYTILSIVYALLPTGPRRTPSHGPGWDAFHLITSPRMIGWSGGAPLVWDPYPEFAPEVLPPPPPPDSPLAPAARRRVNRKALRVHATYALAHYAVLDTLTFIFHTLGHQGIGSPRGGSLRASAEPTLAFFQHRFPQYFPSPVVQWLICQAHMIVVHFATGMAFYQGLCFGYHVAAVVGLAVGWGGAGEWQRLMGRPLEADSLLAFWGRRWHQIFRQAFIAPSLLLPARYRSLASPLIAFSISSLMHEMGTLTMVGTTSPSYAVTRSFLLFALGMTAEISFKKLTGRRVRGWAGRVWFWTFVIVCARGLVDAWLQFGVGGARLLPVWMDAWQLVNKAGYLDRWLPHLEDL